MFVPGACARRSMAHLAQHGFRARPRPRLTFRHIFRTRTAADGERMNRQERQERQGIGKASKRGRPSCFAAYVVSSSAPVHLSISSLTLASLAPLTLYRRYGQGGGRWFFLFFRSWVWSGNSAVGIEHRSLLCDAGRLLAGQSVPTGAKLRATSRLTLRVHRTARRGFCEVRDAVWGPRSGASRNLGNDVRASDAGSSTRVFKHHAVIASRWVLLASRSRAHGEGRCYMAATLDVLARDVPLGVRSRR